MFVLQCCVLKEKLDSLLKTLSEESQASSVLPPVPPPTIAEDQEEREVVVLSPVFHPPPLHHIPPSSAPCSPRTNPSPSVATAIFKPREQLMLRANSLKKAIRQIIEHTEKGGSTFRCVGPGVDGQVCNSLFCLCPSRGRAE